MISTAVFLTARRSINATRRPSRTPTAIDKLGVALCRDACPIHQRAQGYLALVAEGRYADAYRTILEDNPFPSICGRVCNHRCEEACNRAQADGPVNIMAIKRFVADWAWSHPDEATPWLKKTDENAAASEPKPLAGKRVAIVGAGPAGLACAQDLVRMGCDVTVFEALPVPGGMMRVGVPAHRLPPQVVQREIDAIIAQGVDLRLNQRVDDIEALLDEYEAVFVAIGAHVGAKLPIPGNDLPGVLQGTQFLREAGLANSIIPDDQTVDPLSGPRSLIQGKRVLVLGGGNVAIDTAMTAIRLGAAWVGMTCLEGREQMPAHVWEVREAEEEGIQVYPARTFKEITNQDGKVTGVRTAKVNFRGFIEGRPDFDEFPNTEEVIPADIVIFSIGQRVEFELPETGGVSARRASGNRQDQPRHQRAGHICRRRCGHWHSLHRDGDRGRSSRGALDLGLPGTSRPPVGRYCLQATRQIEPGGGRSTNCQRRCFASLPH